MEKHEKLSRVGRATGRVGCLGPPVSSVAEARMQEWSQPQCRAAPAVAFEQARQEGKKLVAFTGNTKVKEVEGSCYARLLAGKPGATADHPAAGASGQAGRPASRPG